MTAKWGCLFLRSLVDFSYAKLKYLLSMCKGDCVAIEL